MSAIYKRIIIKLSGEALAGDKDTRNGAFNKDAIDEVANAIIEVVNAGVQVGIVVGGGNIWRGRFGAEMDDVTADHMGMLATVINALCLRDALERRGMPTRVQTAIEMRQIAEPYIRGRAVRHLEKGRVVIFAAGTGNPHFTTDTAAALRAAEVDADAILKCTTVDTLFDSDPRANPDAKPIIDISYNEVIQRQLHVMDITAFTLCHERKIPQVRIFSLSDPHNLVRVVNGEPIGTTIHM